MIIPMARVRILGPRAQLDRVLETLQDTGLLHLARPSAAEPLRPLALSAREVRHARQLDRLARDIGALGVTARPWRAGKAPLPGVQDFARWTRAAGRVSRELERLGRRRQALEAERSELVRFEQFLTAFRGLLPKGDGRIRTYHLVLRSEEAEALPRLREALAGLLADRFALESADLPTGDRAGLLIVPVAEAPRVEGWLAESGIQELPIPGGAGAGPLAAAIPALRDRRRTVDRELEDLGQRVKALLADRGRELAEAQAAALDRVGELAARGCATGTPRSFLLEGWVPAARRDRLTAALTAAFGDALVVEEVARQEWRGEEAPVVLSNPRFFRPFEVLTRTLPLPRYGSIDPTPFMAVFFPMFFGLILGDMGYGLMLAAGAALLHRRSAPGTALRSVAEILGPCAAFAIAFGLGFGELFGDLGRRWLGLRPLVLDREKALPAFLGLAIAIGVVHVLLGLVLGLINAARGRPRHAIGRGAGLAMVVFVLVALLAGLEVLPGGFFTPAIVALLVAFPVLVIAEGIIAPIELLSAMGSMLSYARIMALGTASVMMAVVANRLAGSFGSVTVGILFALLFHLVNFALGVFAPTIHGLRLHYVEFFGKFYNPGGQQYRPFGHWRPDGAGPPLPHEGAS